MLPTNHSHEPESPFIAEKEPWGMSHVRHETCEGHGKGRESVGLRCREGNALPTRLIAEASSRHSLMSVHFLGM